MHGKCFRLGYLFNTLWHYLADWVWQNSNFQLKVFYNSNSLGCHNLFLLFGFFILFKRLQNILTQDSCFILEIFNPRCLNHEFFNHELINHELFNKLLKLLSGCLTTYTGIELHIWTSGCQSLVNPQIVRVKHNIM